MNNVYKYICIQFAVASVVVACGSPSVSFTPDAKADNAGAAGMPGAGVNSMAGLPGVAGAEAATGSCTCDPGPVGDTGAQGQAGPQGAQGVQGPAGTNSVCAADLNQCPAGAKGDTGAQGPAGGQGPKGDTGAPGANGTNGTNGTNGAVGAVGPAGAQGPAGTPGVVGAAGKDGLNLVLTKASLYTVVGGPGFATFCKDNNDVLLTFACLGTNPVSGATISNADDATHPAGVACYQFGISGPAPVATIVCIAVP